MRTNFGNRLLFCVSFLVSSLTFDKHPEKVGQMKVVQEDDDDARAFVRLAAVQLHNNR